MRIKVEYGDGVFAPLHGVEDTKTGEVYQVFSEGELKRLAADVPWLKGSERSFEFWENEEDAGYDSLSRQGDNPGAGARGESPAAIAVRFGIPRFLVEAALEPDFHPTRTT